jgi:Heparinase II/III-like protein/Heparinase II/III N-terminus
MILERIRKLRSMSVAEIASRLNGRVSQIRERALWKKPAKGLQLDSRSVLGLCQTLLRGSRDWESGALQRSFEADCHKISKIHFQSTESLLNGSYAPLGGKPVALERIDWQQDPNNGFCWNKTFYADLKLYNLPGGADIKYPWELSRHQYLFDLSANWRVNGSQASATLARNLWLDWIGQNRLYDGVNWTSGLEVAMRSFSWIWSLAALAAWTGWQDEELATIVASMVDHATYLASHLSYYSSPYNHLIGEATGLLLLSEVLKEHPLSQRWREQSIKAIVDFTPQQFYKDGFSSEQATGYHFYTLGFLTLAVVAARRFERTLGETEAITHKAFLTGVKFQRADGKWPPLGDLDSARALPLNPKDFWDFSSICHCGAILFDDPGLKLGDSIGPEAFWIFGHKGLEAWNGIREFEKADSPASRLEDSGYVIGKSKEDWFLFDAGPVSAGLFSDSTPSTAHGHADTLQVLYHSGGTSFLEDSGIPFYNGDAEWIRYFRSPAAHNTVEVEGVELVHFEGRLAWSREVARPTLTSDFSNSGVWLCSGCVNWPGVTVERHVLGLPGAGLWIADWIKTDRPRNVTWYWQLPLQAGNQELNRDQGSLTIKRSTFQLLRVCSDPMFEAHLQIAQEGRPEAWRYHAYRQRLAGSRLKCRQLVQDTALVLTAVGTQVDRGVRVELHSSNLANRPNFIAPSALNHHNCQWWFDGDRNSKLLS